MKIFIVGAIVCFVLLGPWLINAYKFTNCDFKAPYRCEAIHGVGVVPVLSFVTVWFDSDKD